MNNLLMEGKGEALEAIERVSFKRYARGASIKTVINWLEKLKRTTWKNNVEAKSGIDSIIGYWNARKA